MDKNQREPSATEWALARAIIDELKELKVPIEPEHLHVVRCTIISHLIRLRDELRNER